MGVQPHPRRQHDVPPSRPSPTVSQLLGPGPCVCWGSRAARAQGDKVADLWHQAFAPFSQGPAWLQGGGRAAGKKALQVQRGGGSLALFPALCRDSKTVGCAVKGLGRQHQVELGKSLRRVCSPLGLVGGA